MAGNMLLLAVGQKVTEFNKAACTVYQCKNQASQEQCMNILHLLCISTVKWKSHHQSWGPQENFSSSFTSTFPSIKPVISITG